MNQMKPLSESEPGQEVVGNYKNFLLSITFQNIF